MVMRKRLYLSLLILAFPVGMTAAPFTVFWGASSTFPVSDSLYIEGPQGVREYVFQFPIDFFGPAFVNTYGQAAASGEATADPFAVYAVYPLGSDPGPPTGHEQPGTLITGRFGFLGWPLHPEIFTINPNHIVVTGITDAGLISGTVTYDGFDESTSLPRVEQVDYQWQLQPIPEPRTWTMILAGGLALLAFRRRRS